MAWSLDLLVWITIITASAHISKHASYANPDSEFHHRYDYPRQEPSQIPENRAYEQMNTRSSNISPASYLPNVPDDVKSFQRRIGEQTPTRTENESKVLSWKPYAESRHEGFQLEIPDHCKSLGFCEDIPNYPKEQVQKVISELSDLSAFQQDKLDFPDVPDITQRVGPQEENIELCQYEEKVVYPKAAVDPSGQWHVVLNQDQNPIQGFKVEICKNGNDGQTSASGEWQDSNKCSEIAQFVDGYQGRCKQKFVYRKMSVLLKDGSNLERSLKVPSCCSCVARLVLS